MTSKDPNKPSAAPTSADTMNDVPSSIISREPFNEAAAKNAILQSENVNSLVNQIVHEELDTQRKIISGYINEELEKRKVAIIKEVKDGIDTKGVSGESTGSDSMVEYNRQFRHKVYEKYILPHSERNIEKLLGDADCMDGLLKAMRFFRVIVAGLVVPVLLYLAIEFKGYRIEIGAACVSVLAAVLDTADQIIVKNNKSRSSKVNNILDAFGSKMHLVDATLDDPIGGSAGGKRNSNLGASKDNVLQ
jgi:hypothetical protein